MPDRPRLAAASRTVTGKAVARLRKDGLRARPSSTATAPASEPVSLDAHEFEQLRRHAGASTLVDLTVDERQGPAGARPRRSRSTRSTAGRSTSTCSSCA